MDVTVAETRKKDGSPFPVSSLNLILAGIKRYMKAQKPHAVDITSETNTEFTGLRGVRDNITRKLRQEGVGAVVKHILRLSVWKKG